MGYKLIAADMDGTLLNQSGKITPRTLEAVKKAAEKGILFSVSTGRPIQGVEIYQPILNLKAPFITYNGAMIVLSDTRKILFQQELEKEDARKILKAGREFETTMCIWSANRLYGNVLNDRIHDYKKLSGVEPELIEDEEALLEQGITKILWYDDAGSLLKWQDELAACDFHNVTYCTSKPVFLEFFNSKVSKAAAMAKIGEMYHIRREEMIAVGDGFNDLSMIEYAGLGVAMGNAPEEVKKKAAFITASNEKDGIAEVIVKFILNT